MKLLFLLLTIVFSIFTFLGALLIVTSAGAANLAFVLTPMILTLVFLPTYFIFRAKEQTESEQMDK